MIIWKNTWLGQATDQAPTLSLTREEIFSLGGGFRSLSAFLCCNVILC